MKTTEKEKAEETIKWLDLFDTIRVKVDNYAINQQTLNAGIKNEIDRLRKQCYQIIES